MDDDSIFCYYEMARFPHSDFVPTSEGQIYVHKGVTPAHFSSGFLVAPLPQHGQVVAIARRSAGVAPTDWARVAQMIAETTPKREAER